MHPALALLVGKPARQNYHDHERAVRKATAKLDGFLNRAVNHSAEIAKASAAFEARPNAETFAAWVQAEGQRGAMHVVSQHLASFRAMRQAEALADGGPAKLRAAVEEAMAELGARETQLRERAEASEAEFGARMDISDALAEIERLRNKLLQAVGFADADFAQAHNALTTVIGSAE